MYITQVKTVGEMKKLLEGMDDSMKLEDALAKAVPSDKPESSTRSEFMNSDADNPVWWSSVFGC